MNSAKRTQVCLHFSADLMFIHWWSSTMLLSHYWHMPLSLHKWILNQHINHLNMRCQEIAQTMLIFTVFNWHLQNILSQEFRRLGTFINQNPTANRKNEWTVLFGCSTERMQMILTGTIRIWRMWENTLWNRSYIWLIGLVKNNLKWYSCGNMES